MAKTKRKHLAALDTKKKQKPLPLPHQDVKSDPMVETCQASTSSPGKPELSAHPSSTSPSRHQQHKDLLQPEGEEDPTAEVSHPPPSSHKAGLKVEQNEAPVAPSSPYLQPHADDSDADSWVEVRKQRIIIIIPPLPTAKPRLLKTHQQVLQMRKDGFQCTQRKNRAKGKFKGKASNTDAYRTSENNAQRSISRRLKESIRTDAPPISSMDILLASALDTDHTICTPCQKRTHQHAGTYSQEEASLDTADSSVQPRRSSLKARKGLKVPVRRNKVVHGLIKKRRISLCKSVQPNMARKRKKPQQATSLANDVHGHVLGPDIVDMKEKRSKHCDGNSLVLSSNQAIKISTLRKQLERAGGLRSWLCSVGLGQFKEAFEKRMWSEKDLLQLQMDDLKRMGKAAVGPRRKLIWAINHFSHQLV